MTSRFISVLVLLLLALSSCTKTAPPEVASYVNGRPISYAELEKQYLIQAANLANPPTDDQTQINKLDMLRQMIDAEIMFQRAEKLGLMAADADIEAKLTEMRAAYTAEEFGKQLANRKMTLDDLKAQLRRDLSIQKLLNKEITANIKITDADVTSFYQANKPRFNLPEPQIHLAQIAVSPAPDANIRNLKNDKAQNDAQAVKKIQMIEARLRQGEEFSMLAQNYSEDANTIANGGDLGFVGETSLEQASPELRKMVLQLTAGQHSPVVRTNGGYRIFKLISKEPAGQRDLNDPRVQQDIRETLISRKDQLYKAAYYDVARNETKVENFLAVRVRDAMVKK